MSAVDAFLSKAETASNSKLADDLLATTFDEGRIKKTLDSGAALTHKLSTIDWSLDKSDPLVCYPDDDDYSSCGDFSTPRECDQVYIDSTGGSCAWDTNSGYCNQLDNQGQSTSDEYFTYVRTQCDEVSKHDSDQFNDSIRNIATVLTNSASKLNAAITPGLELAMDLNADATALFNSDWSKLGGYCHDVAHGFATADWSAVINNDDDEQAFKSHIHVIGQMCQKVQRGL
jgi:hypothetical protein